jgi:hypothetical protein
MKKVTIVCDICGNEVKDEKSYTLNLPTLEASKVVLSNRDCGTPNPVIKLREVDVCPKCAKEVVRILGISIKNGDIKFPKYENLKVVNRNFK